MNIEIAKNWLKLAPIPFDAALKRLSFREREVLRRRLGIGSTRPLTLSTIAECFNVSVARVRQIEGKAHRKMYHLMRETINSPAP